MKSGSTLLDDIGMALGDREAAARELDAAETWLAPMGSTIGWIVAARPYAARLHKAKRKRKALNRATL